MSIVLNFGFFIRAFFILEEVGVSVFMYRFLII